MTRVPLEALVARQFGVVARWQMPAVGVTPSTLRGLLARRILIEIHLGVYALGHRQLRTEGHWLAAVLACGPGAALSHREAAALHGLRSSGRSRVDVTTRRRLRDRRPGVDVHHTTTLDAEDITSLEGIPVTTVERTLVDLADVVPRDSLAKAIREADHQRVVDVRGLRAAMARTRHRPGPGHARLAAVLEESRRRGIQLTRSVLEDRFVKLCERHGLPRPRMNAYVEGMEVDACWPADRLAVELDGWQRHRDRQAFQRDRAKGNELTEAGWRLLRYTHDDVVRQPGEIAARIRRLLTDA